MESNTDKDSYQLVKKFLDDSMGKTLAAEYITNSAGFSLWRREYGLERNKYQETVTKYSKEGLVEEEIITTEDGNIEKYQMLYNEKGEIINELTFLNGELFEEVKHSNNDYNFIGEYYQDGELIKKVVFKLDNDNVTIEELHYEYGKLKIHSKAIPDQPLCTAVELYDEEEKVYCREFNKYYDDNQLLLKKVYDSSNECIGTETYEYHEDRVISIKYDYKKEDPAILQFAFSYNDDGYLISEVIKDYLGEIRSITANKYDEANNLTERHNSDFVYANSYSEYFQRTQISEKELMEYLDNYQ